MKIGYIIGGVLCGLYAVAQVLQLLGLFGVQTYAGFGIALLGAIGSYVCFKKAFEQPNPEP